MNITIDRTKRGKFSARNRGIDLGVVHTTEGSYHGDLAALTGAVSIHSYVPIREGVEFAMVDHANTAWHCGYGKLGGSSVPGPWTTGWNERSIGWELEHRSGNGWTTEHLARSFFVVRRDARLRKLPRIVRHRDIAFGRPGSMGGQRSDPTDFPFWDSFAKLAILEPYPFKAQSPDISSDVWKEKLAPILSPQDAGELYVMAVRRGFRPGPLLALIGAESRWGTEGVATITKNWGNVRTSMNGARVASYHDGWPVFRSWQESLEDVMDRLETPDKPYIGQGNDDLTCVRLFWAPYGDGGNDPFASSYEQLQWIKAWAERSTFIDPTNPVTPEGTYPVSEVFLKPWLDSGGVWTKNRLTPGYALTTKFEFEGKLHQRFERAVVRQEEDGSFSWLLLREAEKL